MPCASICSRAAACRRRAWLLEAATALYGKARVADRIGQVANVTISNVPGPPLLLYMAGARMLTNYPTSIVVHGMALNVTVQSYDQSLDFGLMADAAAAPGPALGRQWLRFAGGRATEGKPVACQPGCPSGIVGSGDFLKHGVRVIRRFAQDPGNQIIRDTGLAAWPPAVGACDALAEHANWTSWKTSVMPLAPCSRSTRHPRLQEV